MDSGKVIAWKLFRQMKDGSIAPLFKGKKKRLETGVWLDAECIPTKGYAVRKGWHCTLYPEAPHLSQKGRTWYPVEVQDFEEIKRPKSQGGKWLIAQKIKILE